MKNKCLFVLLLALGCCHVQAQKSQKNPLPEALVQLNQKVDSELIPGIKRSPLIGISTDINPEKPDVPINKNDAFQKVQKRRVQEKR